MNTGPTNPLPPSTDEEAAAGNLLPDPVLPPRALAELRLAFRADADIPEEVDLRFLNVLQQNTQRKRNLANFWRGFQIAAVCAIVASFMYYGARARDTDRTHIPSINDRAIASTQTKDAEASAPMVAAKTEAQPAPSNPVTLAARNVTILDAFNLARRLESTEVREAGVRSAAPASKRSGGFTASGERISEIDEVDKLAAAAVGTDFKQVQRLRRAEAFARAPGSIAAPQPPLAPLAATEGLADRAGKLPFAEKHVRILSYDIMLDVGTRSLAAFQVEVSMSAPDTAMVTLMWVRGGDHPALQRQPFFDTDRVRQPGSRVTFNIANFDTGRDLPTGDVLVSRLVLVVVGNGTPGVSAKLVVAAGPDGVPIPAGLRVTERPPLNNPEEVQKCIETDGQQFGK